MRFHDGQTSCLNLSSPRPPSYLPLKEILSEKKMEISKNHHSGSIKITFIRSIVESGPNKNFFAKYIAKQPQSFEFSWRGTCFIK
jgi:hypothetical protein